MSLLEDVFLQDEANEAQELERVIEGGDYEERLRSDSDNNSEKEDEAEEDKRRVDPASTKTKRVVKNPRFTLNPARLTGPRGIQVIPEHFNDFKFRGKGHEKEDLELVLKKLEHWAYRLYPKFKFEDCLKKIEVLGKKRPVMVHLQKIRSDQFISEEIVEQKDSSEDEAPQQEDDEFDKLLQQQIELARATPAPGSVKKNVDNSFSVENRSLAMPKATSSPSISDEQRERMLRNRKMAEERRLARLKTNNSDVPNDSEENNKSITRKHTKVNVIDSSDDENEHNIPVDAHKDKNEKSTSNTFDDLRISGVEAINSNENTTSSELNENQNSSNVENETNTSKERISEKDNMDSEEIIEAKATTSSENINPIVDNQEKVVLENSIIQSTIQGLVENDNNLNLERDLINQDFVEDEITREENAGVNIANETQQDNECDNIMDVDFSEEF